MKYKKLLIFFLFLLFNNLLLNPIPRKLIYAEQYYRLYEENLYTYPKSYRRNIYWLEKAIKYPHIHPIQAIFIVKTKEEYEKYKALFKMHINYLLTKNYMGWAWQYNKQDVVFYNLYWAKELEKSFNIAIEYYKLAKHYWDKTKEWSDYASSFDFRLAWEKIEDEHYLIRTNKLEYDYDTVIELELQDLERKLNLLMTLER